MLWCRGTSGKTRQTKTITRRRSRPKANEGPRHPAGAGSRRLCRRLLWLMINPKFVKRAEEFVPSCGNHQLYPRRSAAASPRLTTPAFLRHCSPQHGGKHERPDVTAGRCPAFPARSLTGRHANAALEPPPRRNPVCLSVKEYNLWGVGEPGGRCVAPPEEPGQDAGSGSRDSTVSGAGARFRPALPLLCLLASNLGSQGRHAA